MRSLVEGIARSWPVVIALAFIALYPVVTAIAWVVGSLIYAYHREGSKDDFYAVEDENLPKVSILVPAYREASVLDGTLEVLHVLDYPDYEVLIVDDGSPDATSEIARSHLEKDKRFRLLRKEFNEGKAMAMNDAIPLLNGEIVVVVDADAKLRADALRPIVAHFVRLPRVGAVTGNPRVANRRTLISELQTLEFTSIVSLLRRSQVVWGRILTVSGVISAFRKSALVQVGLFDPTMVTEDIDISWRLQKRFYDIRYEPRALVDMTVPSGVVSLWKQRRRWAKGLIQVLVRHRSVITSWKSRRQWPVYIEACLSILWAHIFIVMLGFWVICLSFNVVPPGASPFPNSWGLILATTSIIQLSTGVWLDSHYDPTVKRALWIAPLYPLGYWLFMSLVTVRSTIPALLSRPNQLARWALTRIHPIESPAKFPAKSIVK